MSPLNLLRSRGNSRRGRRVTRKHELALLEPLESRTLLSNVSWTGQGDGKSWTVVGNWSGNAVPGSNDDVTISLSSNPTIQITSGTQSVHSVTSTDPLSISGGSLAVAANSSLSGGLTMTGGSLTAAGSGVTFTVSGTTTVSGGSLYAQSGGTLSMPGLTSYTGVSGDVDQLQASGAGSTLSLPQLTKLTETTDGGSSVQIQAVAGGDVELPGLTQLSGGTQQLESDGSGSELNISGVTSFQEASGLPANPSQLQVTHGGAVSDPKLTSFKNVNLTLDGTGTIATDQIATFTADTGGPGRLTLSGGSLNLKGMTDGTAASFLVSGGGTLILPLTSYTGVVGDFDLFQATGAGSTLSLPQLTKITESTTGGSYTQIQALAGGDIELPGLTQLSGGIQQLESDGSGSELNISGLTSFQEASGLPANPSQLQVTHGGAVSDPKLTSFKNVNLTLDGTGTIATDQITTFTADTGGPGRLTLSGGSLNLKGMTDGTAASFLVSGGGTLILPLTSYTGVVGDFDLFQATGAGSTLSLPQLTKITESTTGGSYTQIQALAGGDVELPGLTQLSGGTQQLESDGSGSELNISGVTSFQEASGLGSNPSQLQVTHGGAVSDPKLTSFNNVNLTLDGTGTLNTQQISTFAGGTLNINNGTLNLAGLTNVGNSSIEVSGGASVSLAGVAGADNATISVSGGASLSLPGLTSADNATISVSGGASLVLPAPTAFTASGATATVTDGSSITIGSGVLSPPSSGTNATINVPQFPQGMILDMNPKGTFSGGTTFNIGQGAIVDLTSGTYTGGVVFNVAQGATVDLTGGQTVTYSGTLTGSGAGTVQLSSGPLDIGVGGITLNFAGSMFLWTGGYFAAASGDVTNLGMINLAGPNEKGFVDDGTFDNQGTIIQAGAGNLGLHSDGQSPTILKIESGASYLIESDSGVDNPFGGQTIVDNAGTIKKTAGTGTSTILVNGALDNTGTIEADAGTLDLEPTSFGQLSGGTLTGGTWNALDGASLEFPSGTNITSNAATITLGGSGATIAALGSMATNSGSLSLTGGSSLTTSGDFSNSGSLTVGAGSALHVGGSFTQTSAGSLGILIGGTPASGQYGRVAVTGTAAPGGNLNVGLVNGFSPTLGQDYPVVSFAGATGGFAKFTGLPSGMTATQTTTALDLDMPATGADLGVTSVTAPSSAAVGQSISVSWQVQDQDATAASGSWQDSVYLSPTPSITSSAILLGMVPHSGGLGVSSTYSGSLTAPLPALAPGAWYVLVQVDSLDQIADPNRANNTLAAPAQLAVSLPSVTLGKAVTGSFTAAEQDDYYQVTVPAGGSLVVSATSSASSGALALYVSQGSIPTPYNYQESADVSNQPDQTAIVPQVLTSGTYNILVHSVSGAAATASYSLTATQSSAPTVSAIAPASGGNAGNVTVEIDGTNFAPTTTASLTLGGTTLNATTIDFVNASRIYATFDLAGAATGNYTLSVRQGSQSITSASQFQVISANPASLNVVLIVPQFVRSGRTGTVVITYTNQSNNDIVAPLLTISSTNASVFFSTPDDPNDYVQSAQVLAAAPSGPAGILRPGQAGQLTLTLLSNDTINNDTIPVQVDQIESGQTIDWASQKTSLQPGSFTSAAWNVIWNNLMAAVGSTTDSYNAALAQAATYLGGLGETTAQVSDVSSLWSFLVAQANASFPTSTLASAVDASLPSPGNLSLAIGRTFVSTIAGRYQQGIFGTGWVTSWQASLSTDASGNVTINSDGALGFFVKEANGSYLDTDAEYGTLTSSGGSFTFADSAGIQYLFLPNGRLSDEQDTNGNRISLGYNTQNQLVTLTYSNPSDSSEPTEQLTLTYNSHGFVSQIADGTGDTWGYTYDSAGHLLSVAGPGGLTTSYTYDTGTNPETANALLSITNPDGSRQNFTYDSQGRLSGTSQNGGADPIAYTYDGEAEVTAADAAGDKTTVWYNSLGLAARVADPLGGLSSYSYDINGNLVSYTDAAGDTYQYTYDGSGNLTQSVNPLGQTVQMTYGSLDTLTSITDADHNTTQYNYNAAGNLLSIAYPDGTKQSFTYDPLGNMSETVEQNGDPVSYQDNAQGLVTQESFADQTSETFTYDAHGNLLTAETFDATGTLTGTTTLTYNAANALTSITYPNGQYLDFTYNAQGQRTESVDQDGFTVNYSYDALGRLSELTDGSHNLIVLYTYNNLGELVEKVNGNGTSTTYAYDAAGDLTSEVNDASDGKTVNSSFTYIYNALGEVTSMTDAAGNKTSYGYDATGQLTQVTLPGAGTITYIYNAAGDRTEVINNGTPTSYSSNADNEITSVGSATYTYDANGNLHTVTDSTGTTNYDYNDLNQLVSITAPDGTITTFQYSPLGFLVGENVGGTQTNDLVDPTGLGNVVASYNGSGTLIAHYVYGAGLVSQAGPSGTVYYDFDRSGNTVGITGSTGSYVNQYSYLPFGETTTISAKLPNPFTFAGQAGVLQIGNDLFKMRAREYTPTTGQFLSNDPTGLAGGDTNIRRYALNSPNNLFDPSGLASSFFIGFSGGFPGGSATSGYTINSNGDIYYTSGYGETSGGFTFFSYSPYSDVSEGHSLELSGTLGHDVLGATAHVGLDSNGNPYWSSSSIDGGWGLPGASVNHYTNHKVGDLLHPPLIGPKIPYPPWYTGNKDSDDPNALLGPGGYGAQSFIQPTGTWSYTVDFENDGSVAAQDVTVTQRLDPNLDWSTFQLGSFGFGPVRLTIPSGLTEYQTNVAYQNVDGSSLNVQVALDFNVQTGLLTVSFTSLDPITGQAPTGVNAGFLPPDNSSGVGEGYVQYTIQPKLGLATGTTINQQAAVVFDINAPLNTDTAVNTIDSGTPASSVAALPAGENSPSFTVSWSGSDGAGPGIASYNVSVSDDGGPFQPFLTNTTQTSAIFTGQVGHTYDFFSVATDPLGFVQPTPTTAQATTTVINTPTPPPLVTVTSVRDVTNKKHQVTEVLVTFSGAVNVAEAKSLGTYRLATPGKHGSYTAKNAGIIKLKSASYNAASNTVTLIPKKPFALTKPVQVLIDGVPPSGLQDSSGRLIDGDHNGTAGGNAVAVITKSRVTTDAVSLAQAEVPATVTGPALIDVLLEADELATGIPGLPSRRARRSMGL